MKAKVKMKPAGAIKARLGIQKGGPAHAHFTSRCFAHMTKFVPGGTKSHLNREAELQVDKIIYKSPDAHYLHTGKLYIDPETGSAFARKGVTKVATKKNLKYHTPGTGAHWDKLMWTSQKDEIIKEVQEYVNRGCKK